MTCINLQKNSRIFMSSVGDLSLATPSNTWELSVLTGYAMSDTGSYSDITNDNDRKIKRITQAHLPVNWNFQTYIRPTGASLQHYANSTVAYSTADGKARPVADWFMWQALVSNVEIGDKSAWHHNLSTDNVVSSLSASSSTSELKAAQENYIYFNADNLWYKVSNAVVNSAVLDASISELATVTWSGLGTDIIEIAASNVVSNASNLNAEYSYHPFEKMNVAGEISTNSYITNRLSTIHFTVNSNNYSFPVINFNFNYKNGIKYLSRKQINEISVPVGQYADSRDISGFATMYLRDTAFINELRSFVSPTASQSMSNATIKIGNDMIVSMSNVHFKIPSIAVGDAFTFTADFISEEVTEIEFPNSYSAADFTLDFENDVFFSSNNRKSMSDLLFAGRTELKNAWMSDGSIGWAGHNLLSYSEDFSQSTWTLLGADSSINSLIEDANNSTHECYSANTLEAVKHVATVEAKANGSDWIMLRLNTSGAAKGAYFNIANGTVGTVDTGYSATIEAIPNGYYKCSISTITTADSYYFGIQLASADSITTYTGDGVSGVYLRKANLYRNDYGGMQLNNGENYYKSGDSNLLIPDNSFNAPAVAYDPTTKARNGIVVEPTITRLNKYPICNTTDWSATGTITDLSLSALSVFPGVLLSTTSILEYMRSPTIVNIVSGDTYTISAYYRAGTTGSIDISLTDTTNYSSVQGTIGSLAISAQNVGSITELTETVLSDGVTYRLDFKLTTNSANDLRFHITPNNIGDVVFLGAFFQDKPSNAPILSNIGYTEIITADYVQIGRELSTIEYVSNYGFTDRSTWELGANAVIEGKVLQSYSTPANTSIAAQDLSTDSLKYYNIAIDYASNNSIEVYDSYYTVLATLDNSNVSADFMMTDNYIDIQSTNTFNGYINSISIKEWLPFKSFDSDKGTFVITAKIENDNSYILASSDNSYFAAKNLSSSDNVTISSTISNYANSDYFTVTTTYDSNITIQAGSATTDSTSNSYETFHMAPTNGILQLGNLNNTSSASGIIKKLEYFNEQIL